LAAAAVAGRGRGVDGDYICSVCHKASHDSVFTRYSR